MPDPLAMNRSRIALPDDMVRAFSGSGAVSLRDHTVTGLRNLQMAPFEHRGWEFELAFRERRTGTIIRDFADTVWAYHRATEQGMHPLAINHGDAPGATDFDPLAGDHHERSASSPSNLRGLVLQTSTWEPNRLTRRGTFHKRIDGVLTSFSIVTEATTSPTAPVAYLTVELHNRTDVPLDLDVWSVQRVRRGHSIDHVSDDLAERIDWRTIAAPTSQWPAGRQAVRARFAARVDADLPVDGEQWRVVVAGGETVRAVFRISIGVEPARPAGDPAAQLARDRGEYDKRRGAFVSPLPRIRATEQLERFYDVCIHTVFEARWDRPDWQISPFYSAGSWLATLAWDTSYSAGMLALIEPDSLRRTLLALAEAGLTRHSYLLWDGGFGPHYAYTLFAALRAVQDSIRVTGDPTILGEVLGNGRTLLAEFIERFDEVVRERRDETGLVWFSDETGDHLETRTDGYQGAVATINLVVIESLLWIAEQHGCPPERAAAFSGAAAQIRAGLDRLWDPGAGWFDNRLSDGTRERFVSFHLFDALTSRGLRDHEREAMVAHLREGAFLSEFGMHSVSLEDEVHYDYDDADWGGGGQYTGMPLRIALDLWRTGHATQAWDILGRCARWVEAFPYIPQEIQSDALRIPDIEQHVELAAGAGVQAIVFGLFGIRPDADGSLTIAPAFLAAAVGFELEGYRHAGGEVGVALGADGFEVTTASGSSRASYGESIRLEQL